MTIDSKRTMTAFKSRNSKELTYPDHYSVILKLKGMPLKKKIYSSKKPFTRWNTNKNNGWLNYKLMTTNNNKLSRIAESFDIDPDSDRMH